MPKYVTQEEFREETGGMRRSVEQLRLELHASVDRLDQAIAALRHDLNAAVAALEQRMDRIEHRLSRYAYVGGTALFMVFLVELLILRKVGL